MMTKEQLKTLPTGTLLYIKSKKVFGEFMGFSFHQSFPVVVFIEQPLNVETPGLDDIEILKEIPNPELYISCKHQLKVFSKCKKCPYFRDLKNKIFCSK